MRYANRIKQTYTPSLLILYVIMSLIFTGCTSTEPSIPISQNGSHDLRAEVKPINGMSLTLLKEGSNRIEYIQGDHKGQMFTVTREKVPPDACKETVPTIRSMTVKEADGRLILLSEEDVDENVAITYDPPFVLLPREIHTGSRYEGVTAMTIHNLKTGSKRDSGQCTYTVELLGMQIIDTPAGTFDAYLFKTTRQMSLSLATVNVVIHTAHVPDRGIIMTRVQQQTKPLGLFSIHKTSEWRLAK